MPIVDSDLEDAHPITSTGTDVIQRMIQGNRVWVEKSKERFGADYFEKLSQGQSPEVCFIGCSDSRVPAERMTKMKPGELFVHRNIANVVAHNDISALSVLQFSVLSLKVKHIVVCGHDHCGGVAAALSGTQLPGVIDPWLNTIRDVITRHQSELAKLPAPARLSLTVKLNVANSLRNVCLSPAVREAWKDGRDLSVHGWVYDLGTGLVEDLGISVKKLEDLEGWEKIVEERIVKKVLAKVAK
ncbi:carbonic anhydrase [Gonapodya prolifera JEL478]|uniref:Carbonic anhydrase n=1 Tax=Gonapodya prolifera (strain JEL478) TaxID=1344416 RepID=A0A139ATT1_GONPJ|nr:carbonic anhydrase [Gonapodya prolifera JEL478]|eukprot:KXS19983.1 carbonic anhydrase [Gonapodya prolifera JEL478]